MESTDSSSCSQQPQLPPGFRFHPTDEELVVHYLKRKADSASLPVSIIAEVDLYKYDPWELPGKATFGEHEWYFFSPRDRKYPNGARPNRAATSGYWKATGTDKAIHAPPAVGGGPARRVVGVKKALVFYGGKPPKGVKTNWIMHEYRLTDGGGSSSSGSKPPAKGGDHGRNKKSSLRLDDWVLCRIYQKNAAQRPIDHDRSEAEASMDAAMRAPMPPPRMAGLLQLTNAGRAAASNYGSALLNNDENFFEGLLTADETTASAMARYAGYASKPELTLVPAGGAPSEKGTLVVPYWPHGAGGGGDSSEGEGGNPAASYYQQHHHAVVASLGDGVLRQPPFQLPGVNWST